MSHSRTSIPTKWNDAKSVCLRALWPTEASVEQIAFQLEVSESTISTKARLLGLPLRNPHRGDIRRLLLERVLASVAREHGAYVTDMARRRGLTECELLTRLVHVVSRDRLIDAVLDDCVQTPAAPLAPV